jgi:hypothetical protein
VNDVVVHPNQGELISCDQAGRIKQWDLSENTCTHELVCSNVSVKMFADGLIYYFLDPGRGHSHAVGQSRF